ncbi:MAG TPA: hypothetical protein VGQ37_12010 [Vicinamibacterales bacterium]|jgi:hypothetical protein|nr:hypothetical protein [Vicinamibacterales bacterium]
MASRLSLTILAACLVAAPDVAVAQVAGGDVTLKVPLNLTKLSADLVKVRVSCELKSTAMRAVNAQGQETQNLVVATEIPVSNGQVVTTLTVVFSRFTLINPAGVTASYSCFPMGTDKTGTSGSLQDTQIFPQFRVTPSLGYLNGTFTW